MDGMSALPGISPWTRELHEAWVSCVPSWGGRPLVSRGAVAGP
jgi:hypothetical protein